MKNSCNGAKRLLDQLTSEKKKAVITLCLICVMAFMWVKVLTRKTPEGAEAAAITDGLAVKGQSNTELNVSFIELPKVAGRNDLITRDFFVSDGWQNFVGRQGQNLARIEEVSIFSKDGREEVIRKVAEKLKLEAIVLSKNPRAFINDKVLAVGDKLLISDGADTYECEVVEIKENTVVVRCREAKITLKLTQVSIVDG